LIPWADFYFFKGGLEKFIVGASGKIGVVKRNFGGVENFIRRFRENLGGLPPWYIRPCLRRQSVIHSDDASCLIR
jgi:hypothetical protein